MPEQAELETSPAEVGKRTEESSPPNDAAEAQESAPNNAPAPPSDTSFPAYTFEEAASHLRRPFTVEAIKFKLQTSWDQGGKKAGLVVPYIDARLVIERLNLVCPFWSDEYEPSPGGQALICHLNVAGITRPDVGSGYKEPKALYSDALKRAAVKFGVGVSLYAIPKIVLYEKDGHLEEKTHRNKKTVKVLSKGEARCRELYAEWLVETGIPKFGSPLDHGDVQDAVGDPEAEAEEQTDSTPETEPEPEKLTDDTASALIDKAEELFDALRSSDKKKLTPAAFRRQLAGSWHSHDELEKFIESLRKQIEEAKDA
jgi:hypothetical protein